jgi:hypothetical protein
MKIMIDWPDNDDYDVTSIFEMYEHDRMSKRYVTINRINVEWLYIQRIIAWLDP